MDDDNPDQQSDIAKGDLRPEIRDADWDDIYIRLLAVAAGISKGRRGAGTARDFVHDAISKTLDGKTRRWDPDNVTLFEHLCGVIRSEISHPGRRYGSASEQQVDDAVIVQFKDGRPNPEDKQVADSVNREFFQFVDKHDARAGAMSRLIIERDMKQSNELSEAMDMPVSRIDRLRKKLRRLAVAYITSSSIETGQAKSAGTPGGEGREGDDNV